MLLPNPAGTDPLGGARALAPMARSCLGSREGRILVLHQLYSGSVQRQMPDRPGSPRSWGLHTAGLLRCSWLWWEREKNQCPPATGNPGKTRAEKAAAASLGSSADNKGPLTSDFWPPAFFFRALCRNQAVPGGSASKARGCQRATRRTAASLLKHSVSWC